MKSIKIGDWVTITKSKQNWASGMNKFVGRKVQVEEVSYNGVIRFKEDDYWCWRYTDGHFTIEDEIVYEIY